MGENACPTSRNTAKVKKATQTGGGEYARASPTGSPLRNQSQPAKGMRASQLTDRTPPDGDVST